MIENICKVVNLFTAHGLPFMLIDEDNQIRFSFVLNESEFEDYIVINKEGIHMNNFQNMDFSTVEKYIETYK
jgi:hypothetical protein